MSVTRWACTRRTAPADIGLHTWPGLGLAVPLVRVVPMPPEPARAALDRVWRMGWPFWARRRLRTTRLVASDIDWTRNDQAFTAEISGPADALLLLLTGRTAAAARLTGTGTAGLV